MRRKAPAAGAGRAAGQGWAGDAGGRRAGGEEGTDVCAPLVVAGHVPGSAARRPSCHVRSSAGRPRLCLNTDLAPALERLGLCRAAGTLPLVFDRKGSRPSGLLVLPSARGPAAPGYRGTAWLAAAFCPVPVSGPGALRSAEGGPCREEDQLGGRSRGLPDQPPSGPCGQQGPLMTTDSRRPQEQATGARFSRGW